MTDEPAYPFLPAFAAIIASAACAGAGPGVISTAILVAWAAFDLWAHNRAPANIVSRSLIFLAEGLFLSIGSARMWRSKREVEFCRPYTPHPFGGGLRTDGILLHSYPGGYAFYSHTLRLT